MRKVGPKRFRTEIGLFFDDFEVGQIFEHRPGRTLTDADNIQFSLLTMNYHPMHCDAHFAGKSEFGKLLINSGLTLAIVLGMTVPEISGRAVANLGWEEIRLTAPVFAGDTIYAESEVLEVRPSKTRQGQGIVTVRTRGIKHDGTEFMRFVRSALIMTRAEAEATGRDYS